MIALMKKKILISVVCVVVAVIALGSVGLWWFQKRFTPVFFTQDAVEVIAFEASDLFGKDSGTTDDEIERKIKSLHEASVINLQIDSNGKAVDPFGTPFQVENQKSAGKSTTTVVSAGPDREFGTRDDITGSHVKNL